MPSLRVTVRPKGTLNFWLAIETQINAMGQISEVWLIFRQRQFDDLMARLCLTIDFR